MNMYVMNSISFERAMHTCYKKDTYLKLSAWLKFLLFVSRKIFIKKKLIDTYDFIILVGNAE